MTTTNATVTKTTVGRGVAAAVLKTEPVAAAVATAGADKNQQRAAKTVAAAAAAVATAMMPCHWTLLPGKCLRHIARAAAMVIDVACGPMAYKTQL